MTNFKIVWNIDLDAANPLEAAKMAQDWLQDKGSNWQFYVQNIESKELFSVDLEEEDEDAVIRVNCNDKDNRAMSKAIDKYL